MTTLVSELDLPEVDYNTPGFGPATYHRQLADARARHWLAHTPLACMVLDAEAGDFFLRSRQVAFPGRELVGLFGITSGPLFESVDKNILNATGDRHRRLRSLVGHAFTPREADKWRPAMRRFLAELWDKLAAAASRDPVSGACRAEFISGFGQDYPARVVAEVLGAPVADAPRLYHWASLFQRQFDLQALATQVPEMEQACVEAYKYVSALLDARRAAPAGDLVSTLLTSSDGEGDALTHDELVNLVLNVIAGGSESSQGQLGHALRLFADHPAQWELLAGDPDKLAPAAVTEVLRFEPVSPFTARLCLADIEYRDVLFPAGTILGVCTERANREMPGGEDFDITAPRDGKLFTFGAGPHFCLGANLARAELEEALAFLAPRMPGLALDGEPVLGGIEGIYGVEALPLRWNPADLTANLPDRGPAGPPLAAQ
jgi:cytochrome P450